MAKIKALWLLIAVGLCFSFAGSAFAKPIDIHWWHAMRGARGEVVQQIVDSFNNSQNEYRVVATYKGAYDEVVNAGVAAVRAKKQPHILQAFEVGTQTMMMSGAIYPVYELMADNGYKIDWSQYLQPVLSYYMNADGNLMSMPFNSMRVTSGAIKSTQVASPGSLHVEAMVVLVRNVGPVGVTSSSTW